MTPPRIILPLLLLAAAITAAGCQSPRAPAASSATDQQSPPAVLDPCAERLHDIEGLLLMYCNLFHRIPKQLSDLSDLAPIDKPVPLVCPVSGKPYIYDPVGFELRGKPGRVIIYDPQPSHSASDPPRIFRWAINVQETPTGFIADVLDIPEPRFQDRKNAPPADAQ